MQVAEKATESSKRNSTGAIDWEWVQRAVAKSEPPRINDLDAHIRYAKRWGGGVSQVFIRELIEALKCKMPEGRIVNGSFFQHLASVKATPNELTPRLINAMVLLNATGAAVQENIGTTVQKSDVMHLFSDSGKPRALQAETIMTNARSHIQTCTNLDKHKKLHLITEFDLAIAAIAIKRAPAPIAYAKLSDMSHVVERFSVITMVGEQTQRDDASDSAQSANVVEFDESGKSVAAGRATLLNKGFKVGDAVQHKDERQIQFEIAYVNEDGSVGLANLFRNGKCDTASVTVVDLDSFCAGYRHASSRFKLMEGYPDNAPSQAKVWKDMVSRAVTTIALHAIATESGPLSCDVQSKPVNRLFSIDTHQKDDLLIAPVTTKMDVLTDGEKPIGQMISASVVWEGNRETTHVVLKRCVEPKLVGEFWVMQQMESPKAANMYLAVVSKKVDVPGLPSCLVKVQCAKNSKLVKANSELILRMAAEEKVARTQSVVVEAEPKAKRQKKD